MTDAGRFPNLERVVVVGHSAGGQLVNRYAITGRFPGELSPERGVHLRFLVLAPSSFLYFTAERDPDADGIFAPLEGAALAACPDYDAYGYGMESLYAYPASTTLAQMREHYPRRFVFYLVGALDNDPDDPSLGTGCESMAQGAHRLQRSTIYFNHLQQVFGPALLDRQAFAVVPGVGHSYYGLLSSPLGQRWLLNRDNSDSDGDGQRDWAEWIAGTDAENKDSRLLARWRTSPTASGLSLQWPAVPGRRYRILEAPTVEGPYVEVDRLHPDALDPILIWPLEWNPGSRFFKILPELQ